MNLILLMNEDTLVNHVAEPVRYTIDQGLIVSVKINYSCDVTLKSRTQQWRCQEILMPIHHRIDEVQYTLS